MNISPSMLEIIKAHVQEYFPSLSTYKEKYVQLFYQDTKSAPKHFAYLCPMCVRNGLVIDAVNGLGIHSEFSADHFPPDSVGGFLTILVCKKCNNDAGGIYEKSLKEKIRALSFNHDIVSAKQIGKAKISDIPGNYTISLTMQEDKIIELSLKPKQNSNTPFLDEWLKRPKPDMNWKIELTIPIIDEAKVSKSLLKAAYLFCFHSWGYEFVFSYTGEMIRKVLSGEEEYPLKTPSFWLGGIFKTSNIQRLPVGLCYLKAPKEWQVFMINVVLKDKETGFGELASVLIPGPNKEDWEDLYRLQKELDDEPVVDISMAHVTENILSTNVLNGYSQSWSLLKNT